MALTERQKAFISGHRVARMATADKSGIPYVIPICYAYDENNFFTPIDHKPKRVPGAELKRIRNIKENANVSVVIDEYHDDWSRLCHLIIHGRAEIIETGEEYQDALRILTAKYPQYQQAGLARLSLPVIKIIPARIISWGLLSES